MDLVGKKPRSDTGQYFRNNLWWWRPLWEYGCRVAGDLIPPAVQAGGLFNNGHGLNTARFRALAERLVGEITAGRTARHQAEYEAALAALPDESCWVCQGTGRYRDPAEGTGEQRCPGCQGTGRRRPLAAGYPFTVENVQEFAAFLQDCGGFAIG